MASAIPVPSSVPAILTIIIINVFIATILPVKAQFTPEQENKLELKQVFDESCKHSDASIYQYGYNRKEVNETILFRRPIIPESYVDYPCNVELYKEYHNQFMLPGLECPFTNNLQEKFRKFIKEKLWTHLQTNTNKTALEPPDTWLNSLLFQYICYSNQYEKCVPDAQVVKHKGSCNGKCKCMTKVPLDPAYAYPTEFPEKTHSPEIKNESDIRCGVLAGRLCIPKWHRNCRKGRSITYNASWERKYKPSDFYLKCESNAGCHNQRRLCECAVGHECRDSQKKSGANLSFFLFKEGAVGAVTILVVLKGALVMMINN